MKDPKAQNAVTWGVFPGKEIVQPTIIELVSFEAWRVSLQRYFQKRDDYVTISIAKQDEAFALWADWQRQYPPNSPSAKLLKDISENYWLVNVVHNDYQQSDGLFKAILSQKTKEKRSLELLEKCIIDQSHHAMATFIPLVPKTPMLNFFVST